MNFENLLLEAFKLGDVNKKGFLNKEDLKVAVLFLFGYKPSKYEISQLMRCEEQSDNKHVRMTFPTFQSVMLRKLESEDHDQKNRELFCMLDVQCKGYLTEDDIQLAFRQVAPKILESNIKSCWKNMCVHSDKKLSYREFEHVFKST